MARSRTNHLKMLEDDLDKQLEYAQRNLRYVMQDPSNRSYAYVTRDDLLNIFGDDSVFTIPNYDEEVDIKRNHVCYIASFIIVYLIKLNNGSLYLLCLGTLFPFIIYKDIYIYIYLINACRPHSSFVILYDVSIRVESS